MLRNPSDANIQWCKYLYSIVLVHRYSCLSHIVVLCSSTTYLFVSWVSFSMHPMGISSPSRKAQSVFAFPRSPARARSTREDKMSHERAPTIVVVVVVFYRVIINAREYFVPREKMSRSSIFCPFGLISERAPMREKTGGWTDDESAKVQQCGKCLNLSLLIEEDRRREYLIPSSFRVALSTIACDILCYTLYN